MFPCALAQCPLNAYNALVTRHLAAPVNVCREKFRNPFLTHYKHLLREVYNRNITTPIGDTAEWRAGRGRAKLAMIDKSKLFDQQAIHKVKGLIKRECGTKIPKKCRLVQAHVNEATAYHYPEEYHALNVALKSVGHHQFETEGVTFQFVYAGGLNHDTLSDLFTAWITTGHDFYLDECDGANWDSTMQAPTLAAEAAVYAMLNARALLDVLARNSHVDGRIRCKLLSRLVVIIKYLSRFKRLSGDFNTSLGNSIISIIIAYNAILELPPHLRPDVVRCVFMGDDYLGIYSYTTKPRPCPKDLKDALNYGWASMGVTPERGLFTDPLAVTFISLGVWPRRKGGYQFIPMPARQLCKIMWSMKHPTPEAAVAIANGIAKSFWPVYHGFPLMMGFLKAHYQPNARSIKWDHYFADMLSTSVRDVDWTRGMICKYNVPLAATTFAYPTSNLRTALLAHPLIPLMLTIENLDPCQRKQCLA